MKEKSPVIDLVRRVSPAVVSIVISKDLSKLEKEMPYGLGPYGMPEGLPLDKLEYTDKEHHKVKVGGGSGFVVSKDGLVLTNRHVVADPEAEYMAVNSEGKKYDCEILARDSINDIAIVRIKGKNLPMVELGDSSLLQLGQTAVAIGNAMGEFQNTVSTGVVSGLSRFIMAHDMFSEESKRLRGMIQTDAAINPGNSGGPLLDIEGKVIGINSAVLFGAANIGFAIPINTAKKDLEMLKKFGHLRLPSLGVRYILISKELQKKGALPVDYGALVVREQLPGGYAVLPGSAADRAKIKEYDIILQFDGKKINDENRLEDMIAACEVGQQVKLRVLRDKKEKDYMVKLGERS